MNFDNWRKDLSATLTLLVIEIPYIVAVGMVLAAFLDAEHSVLGVRAALYSFLIASLIPVLTGSGPKIVYGVSAAGASLLSSLGAVFILNPELLAYAKAHNIAINDAIFTILFFCTFCYGVGLVVIGQLRLGNLIKLMPKSVFAGVINGILVIIAISQVPKLLGMESGKNLTDLLYQHANINVFDTTIGLSAIALKILSQKYFKKIPDMLSGLVGGIIIYQVCRLIGLGPNLGPTFSALPFAIPAPTQLLSIVDITATIGFTDLLNLCASTIVTIIVMLAITNLITSTSLEALLNEKYSTRKILTSCGLTNIVVACFGGIPAYTSFSCSQINYSNGGKTILTAVFRASILLLLILFMGDLFTLIPISVVAGLMIVLLPEFIDTWSQLLFRNFLKTRDKKLKLVIIRNISFISIVAAIVIFGTLINAIITGFILELGFYLLNSRKTLLRSVENGKTNHSNIGRTPKVIEALIKYGDEISIYKIQGPLFFGNAENLADNIESNLKCSNWIIIDCKHLSEIDSSGVVVLNKIDARMINMGKKIYYSYLPKWNEKRQLIYDLGMVNPEKENRIFPDTNLALSCAEDELLAKYKIQAQNLEKELALHETVAFNNIPRQILDKLNLERREYKAQEKIISQGNAARGFYILVKGQVSINKLQPKTNQTVHLTKLYPGVSIGEMALLTQGKRTADVIADTDAVLYHMSAGDYENIVTSQPDIAHKIMTNIASCLAVWLKASSNTIHLLEVDG